MDKKLLSEILDEISPMHINEAMDYVPCRKNYAYKKPSLQAILAIAACLCLAFIIEAVTLSSQRTVSAHTYGTSEVISKSGIVLSTGKLNPDGSMTGTPLQFYMQGKDIKTIRYSVKNQWIDFIDWTQKRDEYGKARNFTVSYGSDQNEYSYLVIYWEPDALWQALEDNTAVTSLGQELKEDTIVLEITLNNGKTMTKAIQIKLREDGYFYASFQDYKITWQDKFVHQKDSKPIKRDILYEQGSHASSANEENAPNYSASLSAKELEAAKAVAQDYYERQTVWKAERITVTADDNSRYQNKGLEAEYATGNIIIFDVQASRNGEKTTRYISVARSSDDKWAVINEGY